MKDPWVVMSVPPDDDEAETFWFAFNRRTRKSKRCAGPREAARRCDRLNKMDVKLARERRRR